MTSFTHLTIGLAAGKLTNNIYPDTYLTTAQIYMGSAILSQIPDFNLFWVPKVKDHHKDFTHYPIFWFVVSATIFGVERYFNVPHILSFLVILNSALHLLADTVGWRIGVHWLAPFKNTEYSFTTLDRYEDGLGIKTRLHKFSKHRSFLVEVLVNLVIVFYFLIG